MLLPLACLPAEERPRSCLFPPHSAGIYDTLKECASISKSAGGIGLSMHNIRATGSYIRGTNGTSNGIVPMLRVFNDTGEEGGSGCRSRWQAAGRPASVPATLHAKAEPDCTEPAPISPWPVPSLPSTAARYVDQGGGKRKGAFAMYCEPWHADIFDWL